MKSEPTLTRTGPAVAGRNASRRNPEYRPWRILWAQRAPMEPHVEQQIQRIRNRYKNDQATASADAQPSLSSSPVISPMAHVSGPTQQQFYPSTIQSPNTELLHFDPHNQPLHYVEESTHNMLSGMPMSATPPSSSTQQHFSLHHTSHQQVQQEPPPKSVADNHSLEVMISKLAKMVDDSVQHLIFCREALAEQSRQGLIALVKFESDYERKPNTIETPLTSLERFRSAMGHIWSIRHHHQLALEDCEQAKNRVYSELAKTGQEGLISPTWRKQETKEGASKEKSEGSASVETLESQGSRL